MQIVIEIEDEYYEEIMKNKDDMDRGYGYAWNISKGTPLPKEHGRLIDAREYENSIRKHYFDDSIVIRCTEIALDNAPTIIEADSEMKGEN